MRYDFAVIGLGRVGGAMLSLLTDAGHRARWVISSKEARGDTPVFTDIPPSPEGAAVVLLAVPDSVIVQTAQRIAAAWKDACEGLVFLHFSGLLTSEVLEPLAWYGGETGSLHPLQSIMDPELAGEAIAGSLFTFEGSEAARRAAQGLVDSLGSCMLGITKEDKVLYHAAAVMASNYLVTLASQAAELVEGAGLDIGHLIPLMQGTLENIRAHGRSALTGPIRRGDWETVLAHLQALERRFPDVLHSYLALGRSTAQLASRAWPAGLGERTKILGRSELATRIEDVKARGMKTVFTNGCFDILHQGHVSYLKEARGLGDLLVVGLNSDDSVRRLKGPERPINGEEARAEVLSALEAVDYVCIFGEDTPYELIAALRPDVLVKGGDWAPEDIVGSDIVKSYDGKVRSLSFRQGCSTTGIIGRIRSEDPSRDP
ncbi:MAG: D-glycero-beta-D-manno-heptose 1-phosphate adenylyltransferase [Desulfomonilia bacterium]|jgi:rfaE bifunctional protein nucleotidyltransferase chain/domain